MQQIYAEPIKPELITERLRQMREAGVTVAGALSPQRTQQHWKSVVDAGVDLFVIRGTTVSAEHVSGRAEPLNLKRFIYELDVPVIVGGAATYTAALHLMRTGAAGVLVGFGGGAAHTTRTTLGIHAPMASAVADVAAARRDYLDESGGRYVHVIADGGVGTSGDIVKAVACGADAVMLGAALARASDAPGAGYHWGPEAHHPSCRAASASSSARTPRSRRSSSARAVRPTARRTSSAPCAGPWRRPATPTSRSSSASRWSSRPIWAPDRSVPGWSPTLPTVRGRRRTTACRFGPAGCRSTCVPDEEGGAVTPQRRPHPDASWARGAATTRHRYNEAHGTGLRTVLRALAQRVQMCDDGATDGSPRRVAPSSQIAPCAARSAPGSGGGGRLRLVAPRAPRRGIRPVGGQQLLVRPDLADQPVLDDADPVGVVGRHEPVGDGTTVRLRLGQPVAAERQGRGLAAGRGPASTPVTDAARLGPG